jgi:hypothetical protein
MVISEQPIQIEIVRGMTRDLPSFFFDRPKINYSKGLSEVVICSAISYSNDNKHMLPRKSKQKVQKDKQRSTKLGCSGKVSSSGTRRGSLVTNR